MGQDYGNKTAAYFAGARTQIAPLLPARAARVLEVGCGAGQTVRWLRETGRIERAWGLELFESAAVLAREHFEEVIVGDAEVIVDTAFQGMRFDMILCLDVLEHMVDPWNFLTRVQRALVPGGKVIISVPNIRCARVLWPLLTRGEWRYTDDGILDRTHLRFFTRQSAIDLAGTGDLRVDRCLGSVRPNTRLARLDRWTRGLMREFTSFQYLVAASRQG